MIKLKMADEETCIKNIIVAQDVSGPYSRVINWIGKGADGYILIFSNAAEENAVSDYLESINKSSNDPKSIVTNQDGLHVRVLSASEYRSVGGKYVYREAILIPTRVTIMQYRLEDGDISIYIGNNEISSYVIPILVNYTISYKKSMLLVGPRKATIKFFNSKCVPGTLFYKVSGNNMKYPITEEMMKNSFTVNIDNKNITVFAAGKYGQFYNVKQKRV